MGIAACDRRARAHASNFAAADDVVERSGRWATTLCEWRVGKYVSICRTTAGTELRGDRCGVSLWTQFTLSLSLARVFAG